MDRRNRLSASELIHKAIEDIENNPEKEDEIIKNLLKALNGG